MRSLEIVIFALLLLYPLLYAMLEKGITRLQNTVRLADEAKQKKGILCKTFFV
jgi:hypothetical protein